MKVWWKRSEIALLSTMTMKLISIFKLNSQARYHGLQLSTGTFFSLEFSLNVSSALKVNASIKLKLTTLYEDIIKWMSFVTIIVLQQLFRTAWHTVVHTAWAQLCLLWNSFSSLMNWYILLYWSCNKRLSVEILSLFSLTRLHTCSSLFCQQITKMLGRVLYGVQKGSK